MKAIAAMSLNRVIGREGELPWHLPEDFKWFKEKTRGHVVLMGRRTYESLGKPLPGRRNLVVTRTAETLPGAEVVRELGDFDAEACDAEVYVIGGEEIFRQLLPKCSDLYLTVVKWEVEGDTFFPEFEDDFDFVVTLRDEPEFEIRHYRNRRLMLAESN